MQMYIPVKSATRSGNKVPLDTPSHFLKYFENEVALLKPNIASKCIPPGFKDQIFSPVECKKR